MLPRSVPAAQQHPVSARRAPMGALHIDADDNDGKDKYGAGSGPSSTAHRSFSPRTAAVVLALCAGAAALGALSNSHNSNANRYDPNDPMSGPPPSAEKWRARRAWQQSPEGQLWKRAPPRVPQPNEERPPVDLQHEQQKQDMQRLQARQSEDQGGQQQQAPPPEQQPQGPPPKPSSYRAFRVLCFGDGLTSGSYGGGTNPQQHPYAMAMAAGLKERFAGRYGGNEPPLEVETVVRGESGETVLPFSDDGEGDENNGEKKPPSQKPVMSTRLDLILKEAEESNRRYDAVVILAGSNDLFSHDETPQALLEGIRALWRRARRDHGAPTLVLTLPPDGAEEGKEQRDRDRAELNRMIMENIKEIVDKEKEQQEQGGDGNAKTSLPPLRAEDIAPILPYSRGNAGDFYDDEVHLSPAGSDRLGDHVAHGIVEMGALEPYHNKRQQADAKAAAQAEEENKQQEEQPAADPPAKDEEVKAEGEGAEAKDEGAKQEEEKREEEEAATGQGGGGDGGNDTAVDADDADANSEEAEEAAVVKKKNEDEQPQEEQKAEDSQQQQKEEEAAAEEEEKAP